MLSISGVSGTGKTSIALFLVGHSLTPITPFSDSCIWVQASEKFPKKKLQSLFASEPDKLNYLSAHIYVIPPANPFKHYQEQAEMLKKIFEEKVLLPPQVRFMGIDNISHHLRYELYKYHEIHKITSFLNNFFDTVLLPIILFCNREKIRLILIHEASYDPIINQNRPFFDKLYHRIDSLFITLEPSAEYSNVKFMHVQSDKSCLTLEYCITEYCFAGIP